MSVYDKLHADEKTLIDSKIFVNECHLRRLSKSTEFSDFTTERAQEVREEYAATFIDTKQAVGHRSAEYILSHGFFVQEAKSILRFGLRHRSGKMLDTSDLVYELTNLPEAFQNKSADRGRTN